MTPQNLSCPLCRKTTAEKFKPFCSQRCANIDLGRWLGEVYTVPTEEQPEVGEQAQNQEKSD